MIYSISFYNFISHKEIIPFAAIAINFESGLNNILNSLSLKYEFVIVN